MRIMMILLVIAATAITNLLPAQNYADDIRAGFTVYQSSRLQIDATVNVYPSYGATEATDVYKASVKKNGDAFYSEMEGTRMLLNEKYLVMVYDADKRVVCTRRDKKAERKMKDNADPSKQIDSLLKKNDSIVYNGVVRSSKMYTIYTGKSMIIRTEIYLDVKTGCINSLVYYYNQKLVPVGSKVKVDYVINTSPSFSASEFSEKRFVVFGRGDAVTAGTDCAGYHVTYIDPETAVPTEK